jgi:hypothetical protein
VRGLLTGAVAALALGGCPDAPAPGIPCLVGDQAVPAELQVVFRTPEGVAASLVDGGLVPLTRAPQGGEVLLIGVRVNHVDVCGATLQVALKDPCTGYVQGIEGRPVTWRLAADGFAEPAQPAELSDYANVAVCPVANSSRDIDDNVWQLEVRFAQANKPPMIQTLTVRPTCAGASSPDGCRCDCDATGDCAPEIDGGVPVCP